MKIIDENGVVLTDEPNLDLGYLVFETEIVHHDAVAAIPAKWHREPMGEPYPNGGQDMRRVIDEPAVAAQPAWDEEVEIQRYIRYTAEELAERKAQQEHAEKQQAILDKLPELIESIQSAQSDTDSLMVDLTYRQTMMELGLEPDEE